MNQNTPDSLTFQSAAAGNAYRPESTVLAANPSPNVVADTATAPPPLTSTNSANKKRAVWRDKRIQRILILVAQKGSITNRDVRIALRVKQNTATEYLHELVKRGKLQMEGRGKATRYRE